jgi:hypothetical protein
MDMNSDPCFLFFINKYLGVGVHAVSHGTYKKPYICDLTSVRINDVSRLTCPVNFNLFTRISRDMHGSLAFLLILLYVIAELRIHKRFFTLHTAILTVFTP